jgi:hypothetical protein
MRRLLTTRRVAPVVAPGAAKRPVSHVTGSALASASVAGPKSSKTSPGQSAHGGGRGGGKTGSGSGAPGVMVPPQLRGRCARAHKRACLIACRCRPKMHLADAGPCPATIRALQCPSSRRRLCHVRTSACARPQEQCRNGGPGQALHEALSGRGAWRRQQRQRPRPREGLKGHIQPSALHVCRWRWAGRALPPACNEQQLLARGMVFVGAVLAADPCNRAGGSRLSRPAAPPAASASSSRLRGFIYCNQNTKISKELSYLTIICSHRALRDISTTPSDNPVSR